MLGDRRAVDLRRRQQRPALRRDAPDAATRLVAARIANRVLHVADERVEPVDHVERAVGSELHADRPEVRVGGLQQRLDFDADETGALLDGLVLLDAEEPDDVVVEEVALRGLGEVAALDELAAARGPHACQRPLLHRLLLVRVVDVARRTPCPSSCSHWRHRRRSSGPTRRSRVPTGWRRDTTRTRPASPCAARSATRRRTRGAAGRTAFRPASAGTCPPGSRARRPGPTARRGSSGGCPRCRSHAGGSGARRPCRRRWCPS